MWKFMTFTDVDIPGFPVIPANSQVNQMINKSDSSDCLDTKAAGSNCQYYFSGYGYVDNHCRIIPGKPSICNLDDESVP